MIQKSLFTVSEKHHKIEIIMHMGWYCAYKGIVKSFLKKNKINNYTTGDVDVYFDSKWQNCICFYIHENNPDLDKIVANLAWARSKIKAIQSDKIIFVKIGIAEFIF
jgi:hypothetical protein